MKKILSIILCCILTASLCACSTAPSRTPTTSHIDGEISDAIFNQIKNACLTDEQKSYSVFLRESIAKSVATDGVRRYLLQDGDNKYYLEVRYAPAKQDFKDKKQIIYESEYYYSVKLYETPWSALEIGEEETKQYLWSAPIFGTKMLVNDAVLFDGDQMIKIALPRE